MRKRKPTYDVFIAHNHRDIAVAQSIAEVLRSYELTPFLHYAALSTGEETESTIWEAMAESRAVIAVLPDSAPTGAWLAFELGAAKAWNKPIYAVASHAAIPAIAGSLIGLTLYPLSRMDEIAIAIRDNIRPLSDDDKESLVESYRVVSTPVDELALKPRELARLVTEFNKRSGRDATGEQVLAALFRMRKVRGGLPSVSKRS